MQSSFVLLLLSAVTMSSKEISSKQSERNTMNTAAASVEINLI